MADDQWYPDELLQGIAANARAMQAAADHAGVGRDQVKVIWTDGRERHFASASTAMLLAGNDGQVCQVLLPVRDEWIRLVRGTCAPGAADPWCYEPVVVAEILQDPRRPTHWSPE